MLVRVGCGAGGIGRKWLLGGSWVRLRGCNCVGGLVRKSLKIELRDGRSWVVDANGWAGAFGVDEYSPRLCEVRSGAAVSSMLGGKLRS
jgi:hypothetical protein